MLKYTHLYNTSDVTKPYNLGCIESDSANINLYVNDVFKTTLSPNSGTKYSFLAYKAIDVSKENLVRLLAKGTIEADSYTVAERKSIFNDKNYCYIKKVIPIDGTKLGGTSFADATSIQVNKKYNTMWFVNTGYCDGQYDYYTFNVAISGYYTITTFTGYTHYYTDCDIYEKVNLSFNYFNWYYGNGTAGKRLYLTAGKTYGFKVRAYYMYNNYSNYSISVVADGITNLEEIDLKAPITKYVSIEDNKLVLGDKATKFYFNPKYFSLPQLYLKLYGAVPSDKDINYHYSDSQQLSMINSKVISFSNTESLPIDIDINTFDTTLDSNRFRTTGGSYSLSIDNLISLDDYAKIGDTIKLVSGTERIEFTYSPYTTTTYIEPNNIAITSARIFHYPVTFYNPNKKVLFSFPLNKGINNLAISKTIGSITYNKSLQVTRT